MDDIRAWLGSLGLAHYADAFEENAIDWSLLSDLDHDVLKDIGVSVAGHRLKILQAAREITATSAPSPNLVSAADGRAERRQLTVLFADLVGSTELANALDPEDLRLLNREFQDRTKQAIERFGGYVARYMGDGVLAYFGYPQAHEDDAARSVRAALLLTEQLRSQPDARLAVRIGIATGAVVVGDLIGENASQESAVVGTTPNLAARLQSIADVNSIAVSELTFSLIRGQFECEDLGQQSLKGFSEPEPVWRVERERVGATRFESRSQSNLTPLIGRDSEMALLASRWDLARAGEGQALVLKGEAGIGKSRLVLELTEHVAEQAVTLTFQCAPHHEHSPLQPVLDGLSRQLGITSSDPDNVKRERAREWLEAQCGSADVPETLPDALANLVIPSTDQLQAQLRRRTQAVADVTIGLACVRPLLLVFEDMHWADPTTQDTLTRLIDNIDDHAAFVLLTARPEFEPRWHSQPNVIELSLTRLARGHREQMVSMLAPGDRLTTELKAKIVSQTDGVPLFLEELTRTVIDTTDTVQSELSIPASLHDSLLERLDRLGSAKRTAQIAAVLGREFSGRSLAALVDAPNLSDDLVSLVDSGLAQRTVDSRDSTTYRFKHALVRDAAYESMLRTDRRAIHVAVAANLEAASEFASEFEAKDETIAFHYGEGEEWAQAAYWWAKAAEGARWKGALSETLSMTASGLGCLSHIPSSRRRDQLELPLQVARGHAARFAFGNLDPLYHEAHDRALELAEALEDPTQYRMLFSVGMRHWATANLDGLTEAADASNRFLNGDNPTAAAFARTLRAAAYVAAGQTNEAKSALRFAQAYFDEHQHQPANIPSIGLPGAGCLRGYLATGNFDTAVRISRRLIEMTETHYSRATTVPYLTELTIFMCLVENFEEALSLSDQVMRAAQEADHPYYVSVGQRLGVCASIALGDTSRLPELFADLEGLRSVEAIAERRPLIGLQILMNLGEWSAATKFVETHLPHAENARWYPTIANLRIAQCVIPTFRAEQSESTDASLEQLALLVDQWVDNGSLHAALLGATWLAEASLVSSNNHRAGPILEHVLDSFEEGFDQPIMHRARRLLAQAMTP